jgi:hypothetical protein
MSTSSTSTADRTTARCVELAAVFQDQLLEDPLPASAPPALRRRQTGLITAAQGACRACPLIVDCLYRAVVEYDVAGYVAGTTPPQRAQIRRRLDITVEPEDFDALTAVTGRQRQVNHNELVRLRNANPHESLEMLAHRLAALSPQSSVTCAGSVASLLGVRPSPPSPPSMRCWLPPPS